MHPRIVGLNTPTSAYIHVPFCKHRCGYCNFTLVAGRDDLVESYLHCLELELQQQLSHPQPVDTLFLGGGTPTQLALPQLEQLLTLIGKWLHLRENGEYSCEANPLDCDHDKLGLLRAHGVNRLSLGGQSFMDNKLKLLERDHTGSQLQTAIELAHAHFDNLSLDLIFAAPGESLANWQADLNRAMSLPIVHLSTYGLTIEPGANFWGRLLRGKLVELDAELQLQMYQTAIDQLVERRWVHYEVSNFCQPQHECRHNQAYWNSQPWWAFGPGASSFLPIKTAHSESEFELDIERNYWIRATNHRSTTQYIRRIQSGRSPIQEQDYLNLEQLVRERLVFGLRQMCGVSMEQLAEWWPESLDKLFEPHLSRYVEQGWLEYVRGHLRLTRAGLIISDSLWPDLLA